MSVDRQEAEGKGGASSRPFFLVGASRSGTTMFSLMLNAHPRLLIPGETWFLTDLMNQLPLREALSAGQIEKAISTVLGHWRWKEWGIADAELREAIGRLKNPTLAALIEPIYRVPLNQSAKERWGDKTPGYATEIPRLHEVFPEAQFLHIIRDGRDVCLSLRKTGWHGDTTPMIADYWQRTVAAACGAGRGLPGDTYMEVSYESLVLETEPVLRSVCEFLGERFHPAMLQFHETAREKIPDRSHGHLGKTMRPPRPSDVGRWRTEMKPRHRAVVEAFAGSSLELAGYERSFRCGLGLVRACYRGIDWMARTSLPVRRRIGFHFPRLRKEL